ncbi:hypothetical protein AB0I66_31045 [Streptomyces sp. NPDC050439]|uniref:hypothetical protein n=1 Tax=unclassified Streptomyces TaxID=2593676 RepID=UPI0034160349
MDALTASAEITPYVAAAVAAYGGAVLSRTQEATADATVALGQRLLRRVMRSRDEEPTLVAAVEDLAENPGDSDAEAALRMQIRKVLSDDAVLLSDVTAMVQAASVKITAYGERSIAAHTIYGGAHTGDTPRKPQS